MFVIMCPECKDRDQMMAAVYSRELFEIGLNDGKVNLNSIGEGFSEIEELVLYCPRCGWETYEFSTLQQIQEYIVNENIMIEEEEEV